MLEKQIFKIKAQSKSINIYNRWCSTSRLLLTIILSISTPKEKFNSRFGLDKDNNYQLIKLKNLKIE